MTAGSRKSAVVAGVFFIVAAAAAIAGLALYDPVLNDSRYVVDSADHTQVLLGAFFEILVVVSVIGTAITLYPIVRRQSEGIALGYVAGRVSEGVIIAVGIVSLLAIVTLGQDSAGSQTASLVTVSQALVAVHDWTFLLGPGFAIGLNTLMLAYLMYASRLVPRAIALIGLVGGPLLFASSTAVLFGLYEQLSAVAGITAFPVFAWEMSLAVWLIVKGFRESETTAREVRHGGLEPVAA
jgi:hypothetical protein